MTTEPGRTPRIVAAAAMSAAPLLALVLARLAWGPDLPGTIAVHWSAPGAPADGFSDTAAYFWVVFALAAAAAASSWAALGLARRRPGALLWLPIATSVAAPFGATWIVSVITTNAAGDPRQAVLGWWIALPVLAAGWGLAIFAMLPRTLPAEMAEPAPSLEPPLRAGERAVWFGQVRSAWAFWPAGALAIAAVPTALFAQVWLTLILVASALLVGALARVTVRAGQEGLSLSSWGVRWKKIPLQRISSAHAEALRPRDWGGWGYRITGSGSALISRAGDGLVLRLRNRRSFAVTVDQPDQAARVLNSLVAQARAAGR